MFGVILFWLHYIIAGVILYHILRCLYIKGDIDKTSYPRRYHKTDKDERLKHPLWLVLVFIAVFLVPILNIVVLPIYLAFRVICEDGEDRNPYYCKSSFTKKY